jgi:dipeptidyl aminopeptidase/acylaminoacyl peptidase
MIMGPDAGIAAPLHEAVPRWPFISADGQAGGFVRPGSPQQADPDRHEASGVFAGALTEAPRRIACPAPSVPPVFDNTGRRLFLAHDDGDRTGVSVVRMDQLHRPPVPLCVLPGSAQQLAWDEARARLLVLAAEPGSDTAAVWSGRRNPRPKADPELNQGTTGAQQLWAVDVELATASLLGPDTGSIWEFAVAPDGTVACVYSDDPSEAGWYTPVVARFDPAERSLRRLYEPQWQASHITLEPGTGRIGFVEGWCSDRGLQSGRVVIMAADGRVERRLEQIPADVTWIQWDDAGRLFFAGWQDLSCASGYVRADGTVDVLVEAASLVGILPRPSFALSADGSVRMTTWSDATTPPKVIIRDDRGSSRTWAETRSDPAPACTVIEGAWEGPGGLQIHGLLLVPSADLAAAGNGGALVVIIHGGPSGVNHHGYDPAGAHQLLAAGFSVLLPNYRGSAGRGPEFGQANLGDPGGAEMEDVLAGARWAIAEGHVPPGKPAVMGSSYGGYLSAVAATSRSSEVSAAVMKAGISNFGSARNTGNNFRGYDLILGGMPTNPAVRQLCLDRSPIYQAHRETAPTLILHGDDDRCVPASQGHEMFVCLRSLGTEVQMATYPREGHQIAEPDHVADVWARTIRWLSYWTAHS